MRVLKLLIGIVLFLAFKPSFTNPIPEYLPPVISELWFEDSGWKIEICITGDQWIPNLNGCSLMTYSGMAYFNYGITCEYGVPFVIDQSYLQEPLEINPEEDYLRFYDSYGNLCGMDYSEIFRYGTTSSFVTSPQPGESIGYYMEEFGPEPWEVYFYLAKSCPPTPGTDPFEVNGHGSSHGFIFDMNMIPVPGAHVQLSGYTDDSGYFFKQYLRCQKYWDLEVTYDGEEVATFNLNIEPNDTTYTEVVTNLNISYIDTQVKNNFRFAVFPNPCSGELNFDLNIGNTSINTAIISIRDGNGRIIKEVLGDEINKTLYLSNYHCKPGIYFVSLIINNTPVSTKKLIKL